MASLVLCDVAWSVNPSGGVECSGVVTEVSGANADLWITGGWDGNAFATGMGGVVVLFVIGLGVGLVISMLRKLRGI